MALRFSKDWLDHLKASVSLVDIAGENIELKKSGNNRFMGRCPFHGDRSPSFSVNKDFYYCFGCKESGDAIKFVMQLHGLSFEEAIEDIAEKANIPIPENLDPKSSAEERAQYVRKQKLQKAHLLNHFASVKFFHQNLLKGTTSVLFQEARDYLKKRGITAETIDKFQIGVVGSQFDGLSKFLESAKAPLDIAREIGLIRISQKGPGDYDFFRDRVLFPLIDVRGKVCGFGGRILPSIDAKPSEHKQAKYVNSSESELFQKSRFLYGFFQAKRAIREDEVAIVVEGYFDVVSLHQAGIENVVAPCGTSLTEDHLKMLNRLAKKIIVFFDQDQAGITATVKSMEMGLRNGQLLYGIRFDSKLDPDEFLLESPVEHLKLLKSWIEGATPLLDTEIERIFRESESDIEKRSQAIKQSVQWLTMFTDPGGRSVRVANLIQRWKVPAAALGALAQQASVSAPGIRSRVSESRPMPSGAPQPVRRRAPISLFDRQLLHFFVKFKDFGPQFLEARKQLHEKDTVSDLFDDTEVQNWVRSITEDPSGLSRLQHAPESVLSGAVSQELQSVIMEGLLQESVPGEMNQLHAILKRAIYKAWARFSHKLKAQMSQLDPSQDMEKFRELSEQFLDLQRKLKEFEDSYVSGKND